MDFTQKKYAELCEAIVENNFIPITVRELIRGNSNKTFTIRHDVDRMVDNALELAKIENKYKIRGSYYFRFPNTFNKTIIAKIAQLGHEVGLHYETMDKAKGDIKLAKKIMLKELSLFREVESVSTVAMHGNPITKFDNKDFWKKNNFKDYGLEGEVYLSVNFHNLIYLNDTGRTWHGNKYNLKDYAKKDEKLKTEPNIETTNELISLIQKENKSIYINVHPERWSSNFFEYVYAYSKDFIVNQIKQVVKILRN